MSTTCTARGNNCNRAWPVVGLALWFALALAGSVTAAFNSGQRPPVPLVLMAFGPIVVFGVAFWRVARVREYFLRVTSPRALTIVQSWRIGGIVFVTLYVLGMLPGAFALSAGLGDMAVGLTAPVILRRMISGRLTRRGFVAWNVLGMLDLVIAVTLGVLSSASPLGVLAGDVTTLIMGQFPLSLIPTFFMPVLFICHIIALGHARAGAVMVRS